MQPTTATMFGAKFMLLLLPAALPERTARRPLDDSRREPSSIAEMGARERSGHDFGDPFGGLPSFEEGRQKLLDSRDKAMDPEKLEQERALQKAAVEVEQRWLPQINLRDPRILLHIVAFSLGLFFTVVVLEKTFSLAKDMCFRGIPAAPTLWFLASAVACTQFYCQQRRIWKFLIGLGSMVDVSVNDHLIMASVLMSGAVVFTLLTNFISFTVAFTAQRRSRRIIFGANPDEGVSCCTDLRQCFLGEALTQIVLALTWVSFMACLAASYISLIAAFIWMQMVEICKSEESMKVSQAIIKHTVRYLHGEQYFGEVDATKLCPYLDYSFEPVKCYIASILCVVVQTAMLSLASRDRARIKDEIQRARGETAG